MKSPATVTTNGYQYTEDTTPTRDENTVPADNILPQNRDEPADQLLLGDLNLSGSPGSSGTSSGDTTEEETTTRQARFKALFYIDNIGDHTTEIRMRTPRMYDCAQS